MFSHGVLPISPLDVSRIFEERDGHENLKNSHGKVMRKNDTSLWEPCMKCQYSDIVILLSN